MVQIRLRASLLSEKFTKRKKVIYTLKISKREMEYLVSKGVPFGENGIIHTTARHRRTYYLTKIDRLQDNSFRVTRTDIDGDYHTHMGSKRLAMVVIHNVCSGKVPLNSRNYTLESMYRLSNDEKYQAKIKEILEVRKQKGRKDNYYNPGRKHSGGKFLC